jgi:hypothetical protein
MARRFIVMVLALLVLPQSHAGIKPRFMFDYSRWRATDIVVASEAGTIDGKLKVLEAWKGKLKPGQEVLVPELARFADTAARLIDRRFSTQGDPEQKVSGARMILFLVRDNPNVEPQPPSLELTWRPADDHGGSFDHSVAWVEDGEVFAHLNISSDEPSRIMTAESSETEMHANVAADGVIQETLDRAIADKKPAQAMQAFQAFNRTPGHYYGARSAIDALAAMGAPALPALQKMALNPTLTDWQSIVIDAIGRIDSDQVPVFLATLLDSEWKFWSEHGRNLPTNWWNADPADTRRILRNHYGSLLATMKSIKTHPSPSSKETLMKIKELWDTAPGLSSLKESVVSACDAAILAN